MFKDFLFIEKTERPLFVSFFPSGASQKYFNAMLFSQKHYSKEMTPFSGIAFISVKLIREISNNHDTHREYSPDNSLPQTASHLT